MSRYRLKLAALALLMLSATIAPTANAQDAGADPARQAADAARLAACAAAPAPGTPLTLTGKGAVQSAPFALDGGAYTVDWSATEVSGVPSIYLQSTTDGLVLEQLLKGNAPGGNAGQTHVYKLKPGAYYLNVRLPAGWSVTFTPIAV